MQRIKYLILMLFLTGYCLTAFGQPTTNSPYSKYGVGVIRSESFNQNFAWGGAGIGYRSLTNINLLNPASYSEITITTVEFGFTNNALWLDDGVQQQYQNNTYIDHVAFGFPVINGKWGMSFGMLPYSSIGYKYDNRINDSIAGDVDYYYEGKGGLNKAYFGNAVQFDLDSTSMISVGANASLLFGSFTADKKVVYGDLSNSFNVWEYSSTSIADVNFDFGAQYERKFTNSKNENYILTLGATYGLGTDLNAKTTNLTRTFTGNIDFGTVKDTIQSETDQKGAISLPSSIGGGISFQKENKWTVLFDYKTTLWNQVDPIENSSAQYRTNHSLAGGFELIPDYNAFNNYFKRVKYRLGARYSTGYLTVNNQNITEYGITFGLTLPIKRTDTSVPGLNLGIEYGGRGLSADGLVQEKFVNFNIGITINDRWFIKRKYD